MIYLEEKYKKMLFAILKRYPYSFSLYGSRAKGTQHRTSDIDICFFEKIPLAIQSRIKEDFEESNLPYSVDLSDFNSMDHHFQQSITKDCIELRF